MHATTSACTTQAAAARGSCAAPHRTAAHIPASAARVVQLQVFTDGMNDGSGYDSGIYWATSVHYDEYAKAGHTWHWPERV